MRALLSNRDAPVALFLDEELSSSATEASIISNKIRETNLEALQLAYDILSTVHLRAPQSHERVDNPPEGYIAIYEPVMQQDFHLRLHLFFCDLQRDFNLTPYQITPNG
ncbi:hypothetical protein Adt_44907 [Abeliophyllum distichum]|uniref:Uncharacterized protein n=1 Tax=Abeliophyllum distichum TaxID=126358 RepID=A0ABD1PCA0_9LAMI